ncbi:penicillin-binding transpeptidase domain-containing protein, partial [Planococcus sp. SIMBA_143]
GLSSIIVDQFDTNVMNRIQMSQSDISRVQNGLWRVTNASNGTATKYFKGTDFTHAGKTGTAEVKFGPNNSVEGFNLTFVGYAPYEDPEIALAVVVPSLSSDRNESVNKDIARRLFKAYFDLKDEPKPAAPIEEKEKED